MQLNKSSISQSYNQLIDDKQITCDENQEYIVNMLQSLADNLINSQADKQSLLGKIFFRKTHQTPNGIYIYGGVGRGKSMLMDLFYDNIDIEQKRRVHFHAFMLDIHKRIKQLHDSSGDIHNPLEIIAQQIAQESILICFDELQVTDIADAMIIGQLFRGLFESGVVVVATSNRHPDDLYKHGLQREQFVPFIAMFKDKLYVTPLDGVVDYRFKHLKSLSTVYLTPLGKKADGFLNDIFNELTNHATPVEKQLHVQGRLLTLAKTSGDTAQIDFGQLCQTATGAADYIEIAKEFNNILLSNIPQMTKEDRNEAKRFTHLIDELYEHKVKLICTAQCPPNELYPNGDNSFEFQRTISRLIEMQSFTYLGEAHII